MFKTSPTGCSKTFFSRLNSVARKTKFIVRNSRKFSAAGYLLALLNATLTGKASFNQLVMNLKDSEPLSLSKQAFWKRTNSLVVAFMLEALTLALLEKWRRKSGSNPQAQATLQTRSRRRLHPAYPPKSNHALFPAHGNGQSVTAGVKVDLTVDLLNGRAVSSRLHGATEQDRDLGKDLVDLVKKRDLVLRDRGYFSLAEFALIDKKGAYWLSRVASNLIITDQDGGDLDKHLATCQRDTL